MDMTKVKCFNCGNFGHYASKCTAPKRRRKQWNELQANEANLISHPPEYARSPEAIRDGLQYATNALMANLMKVITPIFSDNDEMIGDAESEGEDIRHDDDAELHNTAHEEEDYESSHQDDTYSDQE